jgi:hypothetical protein
LLKNVGLLLPVYRHLVGREATVEELAIQEEGTARISRKEPSE